MTSSDEQKDRRKRLGQWPTQWREVRRDNKTIWQKRTQDSLYGTYESFDLAELTRRVEESGFEEFHLVVETSEDYGGTTANLFIEGWRPATQWEIDKALEDEARQREFREQQEAQQIAELKRTRPELFK